MEGYEAINVNGSDRNDIMSRHEQNAFSAVVSTYKFGSLACEGVTNSKGLQRLLNYPSNFPFDLVIYDCTSGPCLLGFLYKFRVHRLISVSAFNSPQFTSELVGGNKYQATHFALNYGFEMNLIERVMNFAVHSFDFM